ncbi:protein kinase protein with tetratricopeptiderepeat domain [Striga asiatica]|uniref:Protein kinase protein with tetratricopeptiderepeat domain n=1 Tax=Striga asiatica TaxID=4170 RepID=A0A5A7P2F4_STRAF|nr:protein kinase protein with tetratricopeptiderepeat domain [Striga asiatica]
MEEFVKENAEIFNTISNSKDRSCLLRCFHSILSILKENFKSEILIEKVKSEILPSVHEDYEKAIVCLKQFDEESSLIYINLAAKGLCNAKDESGYQGSRYDFVIFLLAGFLAAKFGLFHCSIGYLACLDKGILQEKLRSSIQTFSDFMKTDGKSYIEIENNDLDQWIAGVFVYWYRSVGSPIWRDLSEDNLGNFKKMYGMYGEAQLHLKKGTARDMMRFQFCRLIEFICQDLLMKDTRENLTVRLKAQKVKQELEKKLKNLDAFIGEFNVMDIGCFGFQILLTSGVLYQRLENYTAAALSFEKAHTVLGVLEDPFKNSFEAIKFAKNQIYCQLRVPLPSPPVGSDEASQHTCGKKKENASENINTGTSAENMDMEAETLKCHIQHPPHLYGILEFQPPYPYFPH